MRTIDDEVAADTAHLEEQHRRAVVFYIDACSDDKTTFMQQLRWWLYAWHAIGLDSAEAAFDVVVFAHPTALAHLPAECARIPEDASQLVMAGTMAGRCLVQPLVGIEERRPEANYDKSMNT
jgi:hypothetical protein